MKKTMWRGSMLQSLAIIILPLTVVLVAISLVSFTIHQNAMRSVVGERDERSVRSAARAIDSEINHRLFSIRSQALLVGSNPLKRPELVLASSASLMGDFEHGTAIYDHYGKLLAVSGDQPFWQTLAGTAELATVLNPIPETAISTVFISLANSKPVVLVGSRIEGDNGTVVGAFSPEVLILQTLLDIYPPGGETAVYVIDPNYQILYHSGPATLEGAPERHPGVAEAFNGQSGTTYMKVGNDEHVVAYSPIPTVGWAIVTEESWELVSNPTLRTSQMFPLILVPALLLTMLALWFGAYQIVRPLQKLESKAAKLAWGDFQEIGNSVGGIAEIRDLQDELAHMAHQLQAAQKSLHSYIGAITQGQEAERLRLARELHDDTIQSLIALKQRVQFARMPKKKGAAVPELQELEALIEQTIENLRRTTRALRPIYLEDLGLVAALEMLVRETSQSSGLPVDFNTSGSERRLPAEIELAFYRMAQEGLNNAVQHAQARQLSVSLLFNTHKANLEISDDGKGFVVPRTPAEYTPEGHFGLLGLYERAELIGARLEITSSVGAGTRLKIEILLPHQK